MQKQCSVKHNVLHYIHNCMYLEKDSIISVLFL